jgi:hypothetical protein
MSRAVSLLPSGHGGGEGNIQVKGALHATSGFQVAA